MANGCLLAELTIARIKKISECEGVEMLAQLRTMANGCFEMFNKLRKVNTDYVQEILDESKIKLNTEIPVPIQEKLKDTDSLIENLSQWFGPLDKNDYFRTSINRYKHYLAFALHLQAESKVLEVGSAPGHISIALYNLGMKMNCINLNDIYRKYYPDLQWLEKLNVMEHDIEKADLPFSVATFDACFFTEVLEHIAIRNPIGILSNIYNVLKPGGVLVLSTPNVCNISNVYALMRGKNIFWEKEMFYGSLDRHNREFTPDEVISLLKEAGFKNIRMYGFNCDSNWRGGGAEFAYKVIEKYGDNHPLLRNTIMVHAYK